MESLEDSDIVSVLTECHSNLEIKPSLRHSTSTK